MRLQSAPSPRLPWLLVALSTLGPMAIDMYLPSAMGVGQALNASPLQLQQVLTAYLVGAGVMNLLLGVLADRFGRRPIMLWMTALFVVASLGCAQATGIFELIAYRLVQGMAGGAGLVIGLAVVRDLYADAQAQKVISQSTVCFVLAPVIAPWLGGWLYVAAGWRSTFVVLAALGCVLLGLTLRLLPESLPATQRQSMAWRSLVQGYRDILGNPRFLLLVLANNGSSSGFFLYVVTSPVFLGQHLALQPTEFFWFFAALMAGVALGSLLVSQGAGRWSPAWQVGAGFVVMTVMASLNLALDTLLGANLWAISGSLMGYALGWALAFPVFTLRLGDLAPNRRGLITALQAMAGALGNAAVAGLLAPWVMHSTQSLALATLLLVALALAAWVFLSLRWPPGATASPRPMGGRAPHGPP